MDNFVGEITKHVVSKAPCQVILTAPPADEMPGRSPDQDPGDAGGPGGDGASDQSISTRPPLREGP
jgi:APA family basic amino acid/polyamine antiporter